MPAKVWIGVDIGGTKTAIVVSERLPDVSERLQFATLPSKGPNRALDLIGSGIGAILRRRGLPISAIRGIGISCGGPLDRVRGIIHSPPNLATWVDVPVKAILERQFGVRCNVENDANAGAVAEHRYGAGHGFDKHGLPHDGHGTWRRNHRRWASLYHGTDDLAGENRACAADARRSCRT